MKMGWIMGWAVPEAWFAAQVRTVFPQDEHVFIEPTESALAELEERGSFHRVVGYSLGAHLLLAEAARVNALGAKVTLLAPFPAFPSEEGMGGRVARTQVKYLARWVRRDREVALADFYTRAGLEVTPEMASGILSETLAQGLVRLEQSRVEPSATEEWRMFAGDQDGLLDAVVVGRYLPSLVIVRGGTHHPAALLRAWKEAGL